MFWMLLVRQWKAITFQMWVEWFLVPAALKLHFVLFCWILYVEHVERIFTFADNWNRIHGKRSIRWRFGAILHSASVHSIGVQRHSIFGSVYIWLFFQRGILPKASYVCNEGDFQSFSIDVHLMHGTGGSCTFTIRASDIIIMIVPQKIGCALNIIFIQESQKLAYQWNLMNMILGSVKKRGKLKFVWVHMNSINWVYFHASTWTFFEGNPVHGTRWAWETCKIWKKNSAFIK